MVHGGSTARITGDLGMNAPSVDRFEEIMRRVAYITLTSLLFSAVPSAAQRRSTPPDWPAPAHELLIVGTFHFQDAGLDSYRPLVDVDILSPERQEQIQIVVERLARFRPTKVTVEVMPERQLWLDSLYAAYRSGSWELGSNEVFQLGFRLASLAGHDRVFAVDAKRRFYEPWVDPDSFALANDQQHLLDPDIDRQYARLHGWDDTTKANQTLLEHLSYLNEPSRVLRSHGQYLTGNFEVGIGDEYPGVDAKTAWFNRNLKIFANLQRLVGREQERVLLIIGAGHVAILGHSAEASPQFRLVDISEVLGDQP
jgi:hypothetical protein